MQGYIFWIARGKLKGFIQFLCLDVSYKKINSTNMIRKLLLVPIPIRGFHEARNRKSVWLIYSLHSTFFTRQGYFSRLVRRVINAPNNQLEVRIASTTAAIVRGLGPPASFNKCISFQLRSISNGFAQHHSNKRNVNCILLQFDPLLQTYYFPSG